MSRENLQGVDVNRIGPGDYVVSGHRVVRDDDGAWLVRPPNPRNSEEANSWREHRLATFRQAKDWVARNGGRVTDTHAARLR